MSTTDRVIYIVSIVIPAICIALWCWIFSCCIKNIITRELAREKQVFQSIFMGNTYY